MLQTRRVPFHGVRISIPNGKLSPNRISIELYQIAFPHNSPAEGWPYRFLSRGTTGSSILDHDLGHLCRGRRMQMSGHSDLEFSIILEHLPFLPGYKQMLCLLLVLCILVVLILCPWLLRLSSVMLMILVQWILQKIQNHLSQCRLGVQFCLCTSDMEALTPDS